VRKANYTVERARVGQMTDFDRLVIEVWTDGTIAPQEALRSSAQILLQHFSLVAGVSETAVEPEPAEAGAKVPSRVYDVPIEDLGLSVRAYNCLKRAGVTKVGEVLERLEKSEEEILAVRNFGRKSLEELKDSLIAKGFLSPGGMAVSSAEEEEGETEAEVDVEEEDLPEEEPLDDDTELEIEETG
jgi:DNA-directed RNA polymerase subunit alpha